MSCIECGEQIKKFRRNGHKVYQFSDGSFGWVCPPCWKDKYKRWWHKK